MWRKTLVFVRSTQIDLQRLFLRKIEEKHDPLTSLIKKFVRYAVFLNESK